MTKLHLTVIQHQNILHVSLRDRQVSFDLNNYGFDARSEISLGKDGNHLFKKTGPINDIKATIKGMLSKRERIMLFFLGHQITGVFISDRQLNNLAIKHYLNFLQLLYCTTAAVYCDSTLVKTKIEHYYTHPDSFPAEAKIIGRLPRYESSYWYETPDNSIEEADQPRNK